MNPRGKVNARIPSTDQNVVVVAEVDVVDVVVSEGIVETGMVVKIAQNVDVAEDEVIEGDVDVVEDEVDLGADLAITISMMSRTRTVVGLVGDLVGLVVMLETPESLDLVVDLVVVMISQLEAVVEAEVVEDLHVVNVIAVIRKATLCENVLSRPQKDQVTMLLHHLRILEDLANLQLVVLVAVLVEVSVVLVVDLEGLKVMKGIDQLDVGDFVDAAGEEEEVDVEDLVNLTDAVETIKVQLKHLTNVMDLERTIGEHLEMS